MMDVATNGYWDALKCNMPWVSYEMKGWFDSYLKEYMRVFEFGSGGSTLYFASRTKETFSVEHDRIWFERVKGAISSTYPETCHVRLVQANRAENGDKVVAHGSRYEGLDFSQYVNAINDFEDRYFDVIFIDGRARARCLQAAERKLKIGGVIVLDNGTRPQYQPVIAEMEAHGWSVIEKTGLTPGIMAWDTTLVFSRGQES